jgi:hypothetical protein
MLKSLGLMWKKVKDICKKAIDFDLGVRIFLTGFVTKGNVLKFVKYGINPFQKKILIEGKTQLAFSHIANG